MSLPPTPRLQKTAVLLNANARRVTPAMVASARKWVGDEHVYFSRSLEEAEAMARRIVRRNYTRVVCGGGDGTLVTAVNMIATALKQANARHSLRHAQAQTEFTPRVAPHFGLLCLGTGNALRQVVRARAPMRDLKRLLSDAPQNLVRVPLIKATGSKERFLFAGLGCDALALHDYNALRAALPRRVMRPMATNMGGYAMAMVSRTLPHWARGDVRQMARIVTVGPAFFIDPKARDQAVEIKPGTEIFNGLVDFVGVGTVPCLGYGIRMFPFAQTKPGMMQLRVAQLSPWRMARNLLPIWHGTYRQPRLLKDFLVSDVRIQLDKPLPYQHSGEDRGEAQNLHFKVTHRALDLAVRVA